MYPLDILNITLFHRRMSKHLIDPINGSCIMNVFQGITHFVNYQRLNVKKEEGVLLFLQYYELCQKCYCWQTMKPP